MIKFTDVIKANGKFWYVLVACIIICFGVIFGFTYSRSSYQASTTLTIEKNPNVENASISSAEVDNHIKRINVTIYSQEFITKLIYNIGKNNLSLANKIDMDYIKGNLKMEYKKGENFFKISIVNSNDKDARLIINETSKLIKSEYQQKYPIDSANSKVETLLNTQVEQNANKNIVYAIIGILVGVVVAEIIITCILAFDPRVKDTDILERATG